LLRSASGSPLIKQQSDRLKPIKNLKFMQINKIWMSLVKTNLVKNREYLNKFNTAEALPKKSSPEVKPKKLVKNFDVEAMCGIDAVIEGYY